MIITSGAGPVGQEVPQAAKTVDWRRVSSLMKPERKGKSHHALRIGNSSRKGNNSNAELHLRNERVYLEIRV